MGALLWAFDITIIIYIYQWSFYKKNIVSSERVTVTNPKIAVWVQNVAISCWNSPLCIYIRCGPSTQLRSVPNEVSENAPTSVAVPLCPSFAHKNSRNPEGFFFILQHSEKRQCVCTAFVTCRRLYVVYRMTLPISLLTIWSTRLIEI